MTFETIQDILQWATLINIGIMLYWALMIAFASDFVHRIHGRMFNISKEELVKIHYTGMMFFKMAVVLFNLVPLLAMYIVR